MRKIRIPKRTLTLVAAFTMSMALLPTSASASHQFLTSEPAMITLTGEGSVLPIISTGDMLGDFMFEGIPDGIGVRPGERRGTVDVYVAHEQTTIPFFGTADFENASVSKLTLSTRTGAVLSAEVAISADNGYLRFCSASIAGPAEGFDHYTVFANEEANDIVDVPEGAPYPADPGLDGQRQAGYTVALNTDTGHSQPIAGMGRLNHENTIAVPGYGDLVMLTTDDTFSGPSAQLYMYIAADEDEMYADEGTLYAFRVTVTNDRRVNPANPFNQANDYLDIGSGDNWRGEFIPVPEDIAKGLTGEAPQDALEDWSNDNNIFQFIRLEDLAYDVNDPHVLYIADTGRSRVIQDDSTGRMVRGPSGTEGLADNGRVFKLELARNTPLRAVGFSVLADGDAPEDDPTFVPMVSPDNLDTSANSLMVQEDTDDAAIWMHSFDSGEWSIVATVNDPDGESSGIVDASAWFGPGAWILDVQGHGVYIDEEMVDDVLFKRESGQLMLMVIPGS
ncbi:MAG: DUF839 domain-containing protein [Acidimicrobiia bacterium]|nr:DUF839 domain-containing protein [Acidimicrobiia bacterium]